MKKLIIALVGVLIVLFIGYYFIADSNKMSVTGSVIAGKDAGAGAEKVFDVTGANMRFYMDGVENPEIKVKEGDKVKINFKSTEGFHDFVIDEFGKTERVSGENTTSVEFTADKKGEFEYYCSVGKHRANGMYGKFVVE